MSPEYASISAQKAKDMSGYASIRQRALQDRLVRAGTPDRTRQHDIQSGKKATKQKRKSVDCCIKQES